MKKFLKWTVVTLSVLAAILFVTYFAVMQNPEFGGSIEGERLTKVKKSANYEQDHFENKPPQKQADIWVSLKEMMGDQVRVPPKPFPLVAMNLDNPPSQGLEAYWLGHATVLIEMEGMRILTDPILSNEAFAVKMLAPTRNNPSPIPLEDLPPIDIAVISHDHYDHLDMKTVQHLAKNGTHFYVGLGVGAHLEKWQIPQKQIHEKDWWQKETLGGLEIHCTPARHYSGRRAMDNSTLWTSWVIKGKKHSIFHSGDTGYGKHFKEIGEKLGPINLSFIKIGDYGLDVGWRDIHMVPENSAKAHLDLGAEVMFPIHWGTFALSYHDWDEPIERAVKASEDNSIILVTPKLGEKFVFGGELLQQDWWRTL